MLSETPERPNLMRPRRARFIRPPEGGFGCRRASRLSPCGSLMAPVTANTSGNRPVRNTRARHRGPPRLPSWIWRIHCATRSPASGTGRRSTLPGRSLIATVTSSPLSKLCNCTRQTRARSFGPSSLPAGSAPRARPRSKVLAAGVGRNMAAPRAPGCEERAAASAASGVSRASRRRGEARPLALRGHRRYRGRELAGGLRKTEIDAGQRHLRQRD
jgi:hypothetical protein